MVKILNIKKSYNNFNLQVSFECRENEVIALLGPSGSGKTTILRIISGLEQADSGNIFFNEMEISKVPPENRRVGFVFQEFSLFSQWNVQKNIEFGLKMKKVPKAIRHKISEHYAKCFSIHNILQQNVLHLSGGEQRRVVLARAMVIEPLLLLLDEPFTNLDDSLKASIIEETKMYLKKFPIPVIFVTHNIQEAVLLSDRIILLEKGRIIANGKPELLICQPPSYKVAHYFNFGVLIKIRTAQERSAYTFVITDYGNFIAKEINKRFDEKETYLFIHSQFVIIHYPTLRQSKIENTIQAKVIEVVFTGRWNKLLLELLPVIQDHNYVCRFELEVPPTQPGQHTDIGAIVTLELNPEYCFLLQ